MNDTFCRLSGYAAHEVVGRTGLEVRLWIDNRERDEWLRRAAIEGRIRDYEAQLRTKDGRARTFEINCEKVERTFTPSSVRMALRSRPAARGFPFSSTTLKFMCR